MPKSPPKHSQFKKGQSGNPLGGKLHNPVVRKIKNLTEAELLEVANFILTSSIGEMRRKVKEPDTTMLQGMVIGLAIKTISRGDASAFNALMDRLLGKVKDTVHLSGRVAGSGVSRVVLTLPKNGSEAGE